MNVLNTIFAFHRCCFRSSCYSCSRCNLVHVGRAGHVTMGLEKIAVITVEPAVQRFSRESEAFGSSFWRKSVYVSSILTFWLFCRTSDSFYRLWGIAQPMDAPTEVTRWDGRTYRGISIALSIAFVIWRGQAPLNIWTCSSSENYVFGGMFLRTICLSSLLSLMIMIQTPHFHALFHGNRWTAGSTVITVIIRQ